MSQNSSSQRMSGISFLLSANPMKRPKAPLNISCSAPNCFDPAESIHLYTWTTNMEFHLEMIKRSNHFLKHSAISLMICHLQAIISCQLVLLIKCVSPLHSGHLPLHQVLHRQHSGSLPGERNVGSQTLQPDLVFLSGKMPAKEPDLERLPPPPPGLMEDLS